MSNYSDLHYNKSNLNDFSEGITDIDIRDPRLHYQVDGRDRKENPHGYQLSIACQSGTDIVHSVGNVTAVMLQFILDQFPRNTFATALPSTKIAHRQLRHTPTQINTQPYPICSVSPRVSLSGLDNRLGAGTFALSNWSNTSCRYQNRTEMETLLDDPRKGIKWLGKINRTVVLLDFVLSFRSRAEQLNWASYFINKVPTEGAYFDVDTALEAAIPDGFLEETARYVGIPVKDETGSVAKFVDYLNMNSTYPISYRFSSGRHKDAFYSYYVTSILCNIQDFNYASVSHSGHVESECCITFTLRCEFNTIGLYDLAVPNPGPFRILSPGQSSVSIPIFSDNFNEKDFPLLYGWKIHSRPILKMDWGETEVDIGVSFGRELNDLIDYHLEHHLDPGLMISVKLRENNCLIDDGYYVDWKRKVLVFTNINYAITYRVIVVVNQLYINNLVASLHGKN